ncbi:MAG: rod shape-determining protein MreD [Elusimicrobia bacterium]|jgi:rod shape-determining protein MreD|nr:rod shape-determining protein MreD [Elusimicrobiota bacterium]
MKRFLAYFSLSLLFMWIFQILFLYIIPTGWPTPQWLLLVTLVLGSQGRTKLAMTLGFLWGLALDVHGMSAFGVQGWLLAFVGFVSGTLSKNLNEDKFGTQLSLAVAATCVVEIGIYILASFFDQSRVGRPGLGLVLIHIFLNGLAAPAVFWAVTAWSDFWVPRPSKANA